VKDKRNEIFYTLYTNRDEFCFHYTVPSICHQYLSFIDILNIIIFINIKHYNFRHHLIHGRCWDVVPLEFFTVCCKLFMLCIIWSKLKTERIYIWSHQTKHLSSVMFCILTKYSLFVHSQSKSLLFCHWFVRLFYSFAHSFKSSNTIG